MINSISKTIFATNTPLLRLPTTEMLANHHEPRRRDHCTPDNMHRLERSPLHTLTKKMTPDISILILNPPRSSTQTLRMKMEYRNTHRLPLLGLGSHNPTNRRRQHLP